MSEITICKTFTFSSAHFLPRYQGACQQVHGHNWQLQVGVSGPINSQGFVMDFKELKELINNLIINRIDHKFLNELVIPDFPSHNPTAENMIFWMADTIRRRLMTSKVNVVFLKLWETDSSYAKWERNETGGSLYGVLIGENYEIKI
jgi:6-pyruvoyltetrahydropterin/6-carboxytetrahydropterin synthase